MLSFDTFSVCFGDEAGQLAVRAWDVLETNGDSEISREEFMNAFLRMFEAWQDMRRALDGRSSVALVIEYLLTFVIVIALLVVVLVLYDISLVTVFVPIGSVILGASFAFADSVSSLTKCIMFVLIDQPYDVGDRVLIEGISDDQDDVLRVEHVGMLSTVVCRKNGLRVQAPNHELAERAITNFRRSRSAFLEFPMRINYDTDVKKIDKLRKSIFKFVKDNKIVWRDEVFILFEKLDVGDNIHMKILLSHNLSWQEYPRLKIAESEFSRFLMQELNKLEICNIFMEQPVRLRNRDGALFRTLLHPALASHRRGWCEHSLVMSGAQ
jgi:small-conductance mechanosensitive channel